MTHWLNPHPYVALNKTAYPNVSIYFYNWNQTDPTYLLDAPLMSFNITAQRLEPRNNSFADIMYFDRTMVERPSYMRMYSYNLTFKLLFNGTGVQQMTLWSLLNESQTSITGCTWGGWSDCPPQSLMPLYTQNHTETDPFENVSFNMTMSTPAPEGFDWMWVLGFLVLVVLVIAYYYSRKPKRKGI